MLKCRSSLALYMNQSIQICGILLVYTDKQNIDLHVPSSICSLRANPLLHIIKNYGQTEHTLEMIHGQTDNRSIF